MKKILTAVLTAVMITVTGCSVIDENDVKTITDDVFTVAKDAVVTVINDRLEDRKISSQPDITVNFDEIPSVTEYDGEHAYVDINGGIPFFTDENIAECYDNGIIVSYESYSPLDQLGRVGTATACLGWDLMPTEARKDISSVTPTGWHNAKYDNIEAGWLYNRCHLIAFQLAGENANERNLMTGTRYFNIQGMTDAENMTADYIKETNNHVLYRVTPVFDGNNLLADGVLMEGQSLEDDGILFCIFAFNVQPGIELDYATGENRKSGGK